MPEHAVVEIPPSQHGPQGADNVSVDRIPKVEHAPCTGAPNNSPKRTLADATRKLFPFALLLHCIITGTVVLTYTLYLHQPIPASYCIGAAVTFGILTLLISVGHLVLYFCGFNRLRHDVELLSRAGSCHPSLHGDNVWPTLAKNGLVETIMMQFGWKKASKQPTTVYTPRVPSPWTVSENELPPARVDDDGTCKVAPPGVPDNVYQRPSSHAIHRPCPQRPISELYTPTVVPKPPNADRPQQRSASRLRRRLEDDRRGQEPSRMADHVSPRSADKLVRRHPSPEYKDTQAPCTGEESILTPALLKQRSRVTESNELPQRYQLVDQVPPQRSNETSTSISVAQLPTGLQQHPQRTDIKDNILASHVQNVAPSLVLDCGEIFVAHQHQQELVTTYNTALEQRHQDARISAGDSSMPRPSRTPTLPDQRDASKSLANSILYDYAALQPFERMEESSMRPQPLTLNHDYRP